MPSFGVVGLISLGNVPVWSMKLTVKAKILGLVSTACVMVLVVGVVGAMGMRTTLADVNTVYVANLKPAEALAAIHVRMDDNRMQIYRNELKLSNDLAKMDKNDAEINQFWKAFTSANLPPEQRQVAATFEQAYSIWGPGLLEKRDALRQGDPAKADAISKAKTGPLDHVVADSVDRLISLQGEQAAAQYKASLTRANFLLAVIIGVCCIVLFVLAIIGMALTRAIVVPLTTAVDVADRIAEGRLNNDVKVTDGDETGKMLHALRVMDQRLTEIVGSVRHGAVQVRVAAQQISMGNDNLSQRTQEQASSLEETASSMEEMAATVKQTAENASHANRLALGARDRAEKGGVVAKQAVDAMRDISDASQRIGEIVSLIDEISFQTNILALNAAVEASRAGDQGRGFAVVASEVRSLAQRSAAAAKDIKVLINESADKVQIGSELVLSSGQALAEIVDSVKRVTDIVAEIAAATEEQSAGIDQVSRAVTQMDDVTQQNAALVEEASAASRAMSDQSEQLARQVEFFKVETREAA